LPYDSYITTCGDKIYQTNRNTSPCTCYTIKGEKLWEYKDVSVLKNAQGVTVDNNYNVYVTSRTFNSVVVIEPDGKQGRQLISSDDGLTNPTGIYFDKFKNSLLVVNYHGPDFLYNMC
jgi:DNA-binding beta-propeller fold protein YncE